jgi:hypothetical protein
VRLGSKKKKEDKKENHKEESRPTKEKEPKWQKGYVRIHARKTL